MSTQFTQAIDLPALSNCYQLGEVFAYPTEAVYGLGCDPLNKEAVYKILSLKNREVEKGMILIASDISQILPYVMFDTLSETTKTKILSTWPGPVTWLLPKSDQTPAWISGNSDMLAVRISSHPLVVNMCNYLQKPMVSTSANPAGEPPALTQHDVKRYFGERLFIMKGELGGQSSPSKIFHSLTMETIRA